MPNALKGEDENFSSPRLTFSHIFSYIEMRWAIFWRAGSRVWRFVLQALLKERDQRFDVFIAGIIEGYRLYFMHANFTDVKTVLFSYFLLKKLFQSKLLCIQLSNASNRLFSHKGFPYVTFNFFFFKNTYFRAKFFLYLTFTFSKILQFPFIYVIKKKNYLTRTLWRWKRLNPGWSFSLRALVSFELVLFVHIIICIRRKEPCQCFDYQKSQEKIKVIPIV